MKLLVLTVSFLLFQASPARPSRQPARQRTQPAVAQPESRPLTEFVPNDAVLVMGIKPSAILKSPLADSLIRESGTQREAGEVLLDLKKLTGFNPLEVEEAILFADEAEVLRVTNVRRKLATRNRMKHLGLSRCLRHVPAPVEFQVYSRREAELARIHPSDVGLRRPVRSVRSGC